MFSLTNAGRTMAVACTRGDGNARHGTHLLDHTIGPEGRPLASSTAMHWVCRNGAGRLLFVIQLRQLWHRSIIPVQHHRATCAGTQQNRCQRACWCTTALPTRLLVHAVGWDSIMHRAKLRLCACCGKPGGSAQLPGSAQGAWPAWADARGVHACIRW